MDRSIQYWVYPIGEEFALSPASKAFGEWVNVVPHGGWPICRSFPALSPGV